MLKGDNLNKIDTVLVLWISNVFHLRYIGHIAAWVSVASNSEVWKFIQIKNCRLLLQKAGRNTFFSFHIQFVYLIKTIYFRKKRTLG